MFLNRSTDSASTYLNFLNNIGIITCRFEKKTPGQLSTSN